MRHAILAYMLPGPLVLGVTGCGDAFRAHVVAYADDFVILSRGRAAEALAWTKAVMTRLGLTINEAKTSLRDARGTRRSEPITTGLVERF